MKGTLFVQFMEHVEKVYGLPMVDAVIFAAGNDLSTGGAYTAVGNYPHNELLVLATGISRVSGNSVAALIDDFAAILMGGFKRMHPAFFQDSPDIFDFLCSLEPMIHSDVRKLYPDAKPPLVVCERLSDGSLKLSYSSYRPFAAIALALTRAAGELLNQPLELDVLDQSADNRSMTIKVRKAHA